MFQKVSRDFREFQGFLRFSRGFTDNQRAIKGGQIGFKASQGVSGGFMVVSKPFHRRTRSLGGASEGFKDTPISP